MGGFVGTRVPGQQVMTSSIRTNPPIQTSNLQYNQQFVNQQPNQQIQQNIQVKGQLPTQQFNQVNISLLSNTIRKMWCTSIQTEDQFSDDDCMVL